MSPTTCGMECCSVGVVARVDGGKQESAAHKKGSGVYIGPLRRDRAGLLGLVEILEGRANP